MSNPSACAEESFHLLNAAAKLHWRGQGDTWTAARDRAAVDAGITPAQAERLQKNWRTMKFPNGDVYRLLRNKYAYLCSWIENDAERMEREAREIEETNATLGGHHSVAQGLARAAKGAEREMR
ncbi:hypothetical protein [Mesorhizobium sp. M4B.F.Ca.ET.143.01.1.1]|uniref:hypothetical protein n=1 Tax=Mesorhizobium sp. M4B.F.Ca.ET.143.01.1.1 TaxID=2563947 RepID=UPI001FEEA360|nr:hypothetical protein [Mesorhizobium sp. M4B.F.Ca.ET.143.01.1.1]